MRACVCYQNSISLAEGKNTHSHIDHFLSLSFFFPILFEGYFAEFLFCAHIVRGLNAVVLILEKFSHFVIAQGEEDEEK